MGRHYQGDIEGEFWFAVQSSDDGEFFGAVDDSNNAIVDIEESGYIAYRIPNDERHGEVEDGIDRCLRELGIWKKHLTEFFKDNSIYNQERIVTFLKEKNVQTTTEEVKAKLKWFARLDMGLKIEKAFNENPDEDIYFDADI
ncbi:hypothetical protein [Candidatus Thioglobus sp.]|jgi:hypothetical protein|uniref:hypothetical protein n=1 Tax=Candidatus Thioglobus sp. TaxID=2026721 RepID=UPI001767CA91|nr:hypothetical protein [Candidatus Thioglobus sp.]HIF47043.1 hypothetical protein [Candidatus Thioglobus sp.]